MPASCLALARTLLHCIWLLTAWSAGVLSVIPILKQMILLYCSILWCEHARLSTPIEGSSFGLTWWLEMFHFIVQFFVFLQWAPSLGVSCTPPCFVLDGKCFTSFCDHLYGLFLKSAISFSYESCWIASFMLSITFKHGMGVHEQLLSLKVYWDPLAAINHLGLLHALCLWSWQQILGPPGAAASSIGLRVLMENVHSSLESRSIASSQKM